METDEILNYIYENAKMGKESTETLIKSLEGKENKIIERSGSSRKTLILCGIVKNTVAVVADIHTNHHIKLIYLHDKINILNMPLLRL